MREILQLQAGQCGNQIGYQFWEHICIEHNINADGSVTNYNDASGGDLDVFFSLASNGRRVPRAILVDLEAGVLDSLATRKYGRLFRPDNFVAGSTSAGNNWAKGFYTEGAELSEPIMEVIRKEAEGCDCLQGFQVTHSLGGGTGSGLGTVMMAKIKDEYPDRLVSSYSVFPSPKVSDTVVEPYNAVLCIQQLLELADAVHVIDNEALFDLCLKSQGLDQPAYEDLNRIISYAMSGSTASLRYEGQLNSDLRKMCVNLVPFPRLHFFASSVAPLVGVKDSEYKNTSCTSLISLVFSAKNMMCAIQPSSGLYLTAAIVFRGEVSTKDVDDQTRAVQNRNSSQFVEWIPNNIKWSVCNEPTRESPLSATFVGNSTAIKHVFARIISQFQVMFHRKAFVHWYTEQGMPEIEFSEAESNVSDLISEYDQYEHMTGERGYSLDSGDETEYGMDNENQSP